MTMWIGLCSSLKLVVSLALLFHDSALKNLLEFFRSH